MLDGLGTSLPVKCVNVIAALSFLFAILSKLMLATQPYNATFVTPK